MTKYIGLLSMMIQPAASALCCLPWSCLGILLLLPGNATTKSLLFRSQSTKTVTMMMMVSVAESPPHLARKGKTNAFAASAFYHGRSSSSDTQQQLEHLPKCAFLERPAFLLGVVPWRCFNFTASMIIRGGMRATERWSLLFGNTKGTAGGATLSS